MYVRVSVAFLQIRLLLLTDLNYIWHWIILTVDHWFLTNEDIAFIPRTYVFQIEVLTPFQAEVQFGGRVLSSFHKTLGLIPRTTEKGSISFSIQETDL